MPWLLALGHRLGDHNARAVTRGRVLANQLSFPPPHAKIRRIESARNPGKKRSYLPDQDRACPFVELVLRSISAICWDSRRALQWLTRHLSALTFSLGFYLRELSASLTQWMPNLAFPRSRSLGLRSQFEKRRLIFGVRTRSGRWVHGRCATSSACRLRFAGNVERQEKSGIGRTISAPGLGMLAWTFAASQPLDVQSATRAGILTHVQSGIVK